MVTPALAVLQMTPCQAPGNGVSSWQGAQEPPRAEAQPWVSRMPWSCQSISSPICLPFSTQTLRQLRAMRQSPRLSSPGERGQTAGRALAQGGFPRPLRFLPSGRQFLSEMRMAMMPAVMQLQQAVAVIVTVTVIVITIITIITVSARACRQLVVRCFPILALCSTGAGILPLPPAFSPQDPRLHRGDISTSDFYPTRAAGPESPKWCHGQPSYSHLAALHQGLACIFGASSHPRGCPGGQRGFGPSEHEVCMYPEACVCGCRAVWVQSSAAPVTPGSAAAPPTKQALSASPSPRPSCPSSAPVPQAGTGTQACVHALSHPAWGHLWVCLPGATAPGGCCAGASEHTPVSADLCCIPMWMLPSTLNPDHSRIFVLCWG